MKTKLTLKSVRDELSQLGITITKDSTGEYKVRIKGSPKGHGYFTPHLDDALATGKLMAQEDKNRALSVFSLIANGQD